MNNSLPITKVLPDIHKALRQRSRIILKAEPGAGKTTALPLSLIDLGRILVVEPRRVAAKLAAQFTAKEIGQECGRDIGYRIKGESKANQDSKLTYVTEGIFQRMLLSASLDFDFVILDEFHERNLGSDMALAWLMHLQDKKQTKAKLIIMSATLDTSILEKHLRDSATFEVKGRQFPVSVSYEAMESSKQNISAKVIDAIQTMIQKKLDGDILVFLPGQREILTVDTELNKRYKKTEYLICCLYSAQSSREQKIVFHPSPIPKIILSTNIAESSVTLDNITTVIDTGLAKESGFAYWSGLPTLQLHKISQASVIQRSGRAGRVKPGQAMRLFTENDFKSRDSFLSPEIQRTDLSELILQTLSMITDGLEWKDLPWLSLPPEKHEQKAFELLQALEFVDGNKQITPLGRSATKWPLHPRYSAIMLEANKCGFDSEATLLVSLLGEGSVLSQQFQPQEDGPCDLTYQANLIIDFFQGVEFKYRNTDISFDKWKAKRIEDQYRSLSKLLKLNKRLRDLNHLDSHKVSRVLLAGYADRVAKFRKNAKKKRGNPEKPYNFCQGRGGLLSRDSVLKEPEFIIALEAKEDPSKFQSAIKTQIIIACSVKKELLLNHESMLIKEKTTDIDEDRHQIIAKEAIYYGKILISEEESVTSGILNPEQLKDYMKEHWPYPFDNDNTLNLITTKSQLLTNHEISHLIPDFKSEFFEFLIDHIVDGNSSFKNILKRSLKDYIYDLIEYNDQILLQKLLPDEYKLRSGRTLKIDYSSEGGPTIKSRLQDFLQETNHPTILNGKIRLRCVLLAPNQRPAQITQDLSGFWTGSYKQVRNELRRRYPKHDWPEEPPLIEKRRG